MKRFLTSLLILGSVFFSAIAPVYAVSDALKGQITGGLNKSAEDTFQVTGDKDQGESALSGVFQNTLQIAIGVLGLAAVVLIVYAGYLWMAAGGNAGQIDKAKKIIVRVIIGMTVVALAYGIISFALTAFAPSGPTERPDAASASDD